MKKLIPIIMSIFIFLPISAGQDFKLVEKWQHDELMPGKLFDAMVAPDGRIITAFQKAGVKIADAKTITDLGPYGQGPNDLDGFFMLCLYKGDLAVEGMTGKLKIFHKKDGKYTWKQTIWKKSGRSFHLVRDGIFKANAWFMTGAQMIPDGKTKYVMHFIRVYQEDGKYIKSLIRKDVSKFYSAHLKDYLLAEYKDRLFFVSEDEPIVKVIDPVALEVKKEVPLEMPEFYKPMPQEYYAINEKNKTTSPIETAKQWVTWKTGYSRIGRVGIDGDQLVLQVRTCKENLGLFALLFYNAESFKLERVVYTNDLLLDIKDNKYYMFADGNPGYDDDAGDYIVNIYQFKEKK